MGSASLIFDFLILFIIFTSIIWFIENKCGKKMPCRGAASQSEPEKQTPGERSNVDENVIEVYRKNPDIEDSKPVG